MRSIRSALVLGFSMISVCTVAACADPALRPGSPAQTTGASLQSSHTVDNAGFVDPGGRTDDEFPMGELGGSRATEGGGRPPAASPETIPLPTPGNTESSFARGTTTPPTASSTSSKLADDTSDRIGSAICDRERSCNRVGSGRRWKSADSCSLHFSDIAKARLGQASCPSGVLEDRLATCLKTMRLASCVGGVTVVESLPACRTAALCAP